MSQHREFLLTPMDTILDDAAAALSCLTPGMESYPMRDYVLQTVFLKMTGFQEQKLKCICWELATVDYEYRYERFQNARGKLGECSCYEEKSRVYEDLVGALVKLGCVDEYQKWVSSVKMKVEVLNSLSLFRSELDRLGWLGRAYDDFKDSFLLRDDCCFVDITHTHCFASCGKCSKHGGGGRPTGKKLATSCLFASLGELHQEAVWRHRNRCAHNTLSYQTNAPTFDALNAPNEEKENYFVRFALLLSIDKLVVKAFDCWLNATKGC